MRLRCKRVYEEPSPEDGTRILVDRLWPRGVSKKLASVDLWLREIAPSDDLRRWFGHEPAKWQEFRIRYHEELKEHDAEIEQIRKYVQEGTVTLLYGAKQQAFNNAVALREFLCDERGFE